MKKVISIAMALLMLTGICSVFASAVVNDALMAVSFTPVAASYNKGDIVTFNVNYETSDLLGGLNGGNLKVGFDSSVFETIENIPEPTDAVNTLDYGAQNTDRTLILDNSICLAGINTVDTFLQTIAGDVDAIDTELGWDTALRVVLFELGGTFFDFSSGGLAMQLQLRLKADANPDGCYSIGLTHKSYTDGTSVIPEEVAAVYGLDADEYYGEATGKSLVFDCQMTPVVVTAAAPAVTVANRDVKCQYKNAAAKTGFQLGFSGTISGMAIDAAEINADDNYTGTKLTGFGVVFTTDASLTADTFVSGAEGVTDSACETLYASGADYTFRAVVGGADKTSTATLYYRTYVTYDGVVYYSDIANTTANAEYLEAVTAGIDA